MEGLSNGINVLIHGAYTMASICFPLPSESINWSESIVRQHFLTFWS
jgi:hypothetical protein